MKNSTLGPRIKSLAELKGEFVLRSGQKADRYFDKYRFESQPAVLREIAAALCDQLPTDADRIAGLELGGIPLATAVSLQSGLPCLFVRKKAKEYGTCNAIEGGFQTGEKVVVIEDIVTSGGAVVKAIEILREANLVVEDVLCVLDREAGGKTSIESCKCRLHSLFTLADLA